MAYRLRALEAQGSKCEELTVSRSDSFRCVGFNSGEFYVSRVRVP